MRRRAPAGAAGRLRGVNTADWIAVAVIALAALSGLRRGLVTGVLSLARARRRRGRRRAASRRRSSGDASAYVPLVALGGAVRRSDARPDGRRLAGRSARGRSRCVPPLRALDSAGGLVLGAATGLALCWAVGAVLLYVPGQSELRRLAQESRVVSALTEAAAAGSA